MVIEKIVKEVINSLKTPSREKVQGRGTSVKNHPFAKPTSKNLQPESGQSEKKKEQSRVVVALGFGGEKGSRPWTKNKKLKKGRKVRVMNNLKT